MTEEKEREKETSITVERSFEQPSDAISFYCDMGEIFSTGKEIVLQFYETIPGPPGPGGQPNRVRSRLRATVFLAIPHAANIGRLLVEKTKEITK